MAREMLEDGEFIEVFVSTPLAVCEKRDVKGLYAKARRGEIRNFTGIDSDYEAPENPELTLDTSKTTAADAAATIVEHLRKNGYLG
jgi:bifunctional enzyme CysN/CysC